MKKISLAVLLLAIITTVSDAKTVRGYRKKNGTYVAPYHRTAPNSTIEDNYSTKGNVNPYTGKAGTVTHKRSRGLLDLPTPAEPAMPAMPAMPVDPASP